MIKKFLFIFFLCLLPFSLFAADDIRFDAEVSQNQVALGSTIQLSLTIRGAQPTRPPELPEVLGFETRFLGPSSSLSIINGVSSVSKTFIYVLTPKEKGHFQIPSIRMQIDGQTYTTQVIDIDVVDEGAAVQTPHGRDMQAEPADWQDKIFLVMNIPKKEIFVNERVLVTIKLFVQGVALQDVEYPQIEHEGFMTEEIPEPRQYDEILGGVRYNVVEFKAYVYPTRPGELKLGPARINSSLLIRQQEQFPSSFGDDFFDGFFDRYVRKPLTVASADLRVNVISLPLDKVPKNFSGAIGQFDFKVTVSPQTVNTGDPITIRAEVTGEGNLKALTIPSLQESESFKVYDPQIKEESGRKILEQVVIPKNDQVTQIPAFHFGYFDVGAKEYQTLTQGPFSITVNKAAPGQEFKVVGLDQKHPAAPALSEALGQDIIFIKENFGSRQSVGEMVYKNPLFIAMNILLLLVFGALCTAYVQNQRLKTDTRYARKLLAPKNAQKGLARARQYLANGEQKNFYDVVHKTLQEYLANRFHLNSGGLTFSSVEPSLRAEGIHPPLIEDIKNIFNECDMARFASIVFPLEDMQKVLDRLVKIIDQMERQK